MLGVSLPLVCNMFLVVCFFGVRAREADRRAGLALRGVCWERGWLACDTYGASLSGREASTEWDGVERHSTAVVLG